LLAAYSAHAARPVLVLAYQGSRTGETLRLDWRAIDLERATIHFRWTDTKTGRSRTVPMHPRVQALLAGLWEDAGRPERSPVFLSERGEPYQDTRGKGGNPLKKQHMRACRLAGISGFRVHDWRHDWAARHVMAGTDLYTLMRLGGWTDLRMVQKYAAVTSDHLREAAARIA
jgi:integrase